MNIAPPFACRLLEPLDYDAARALADDVGVHGAYVRNALDPSAEESDDQVYALHGSDELLGLVYFGARGNLIVVEREPVSPERLAAFIRETPWEWRIVLARFEVVAELRRADPRVPLVCREQVYYEARPGEIDAANLDPSVRFASKKDARLLMQAALDLNESDLNVARWRVNRAWLRQTVKRRIAQQRTLVLGPEGRFDCKLDIGSQGESAAIIEGVHTPPESRGRGFATRLVATAIDRLHESVPVVSLHVAADNVPARRAYERAGMREVDTSWLMLRG